MTGSVAYVDITNLVNDLSTISKLSSEQIADNVLDDFGREIVERATQYVPVKTGKLKQSISHSVSKATLTISADAEYATFIEFGTGSRGEYNGSSYTIKPKNQQYLKFKINGRTVYTKKVTHPGIQAQPYLRPAAKEAIEKLFPKLLDRGEAMIVKGPNSVL